jgi:hypothetical protein
MSARKEKDEKKEIPDLRVGVRRLAFGESAHSSLKYQHIIFRVSRRKVYKWHQMAKLPRVAMARFVRMSKSIPTCVSDFVTDCDTSWCSRFGLLSSWSDHSAGTIRKVSCWSSKGSRVLLRTEKFNSPDLLDFRFKTSLSAVFSQSLISTPLP